MNETLIRLMALGGKGYTCSQIMIIMALEVRGETNPALTRAMAGLSYGCGNSRGTCGALTGGACVLGLYAGKGTDEEEVSESLLPMTRELSDWFLKRTAEHGGINCETIVAEAGPDASRQICGALVAETFEKCMEILMKSGFDPAQAHDDSR
jgi:C_GCAxxG_C_C family probable redox protein